MERKLRDLANTLIDHGLLVSRENFWVREDNSYIIEYNSLDESGNAKIDGNLHKEWEGTIFRWKNDGETNCIWVELKTFHSRCQRYKLPTNNPVAFFESVMQKQRFLCEEEEKEELCDLLTLALSGGDFPFGTAFIRDGSRSIRECDVQRMEPPIDLGDEKLALYHKVLEGHAALTSGGRFWGEYNFYKGILPNKPQREAFQKWYVTWRTSGKKSVNTPLFLSEEEVSSLLEAYTDYCQSQTLNKENNKETLNQIHLAGSALIRFHLLRGKIDEILTQSNNLQEKCNWLDQMMQFINSLSVAEKTAINEFDSNKLFLDMEFFRELMLPGELSTDTLQRYPLLNRNSSSTKLKKEEAYALNQYRKHPLYKAIYNIQCELGKEEIQRIAPYYLLCVLRNKSNPRHILQQSKKLTPRNLELKETTVFATDSSMKYQKSHLQLYMSLRIWWDSVVNARKNQESNSIPKNDPDLSNFLYSRNMAVFSPKYRIVTEENGRKDFREVIYPLHEIYTALKRVFTINLSALPQITNQPISEYQFLSIFTGNATENEQARNIAKHVSMIITDDMVDQYKELVFLNENGIGISAPERDWYNRLADWFQNIIYNDGKLKEYIRGKNDSYFPNSEIKFEEFPEEYQIYPEDYQDYLGIVELMIHHTCCNRIFEDMVNKVTELYKSVFWDISPSQGEIPTKREESIPPH